MGLDGQRGPLLKGILARAGMLGFLWGFAEGTLFFVVPDVIISLVAIFSTRHYLVCAASSLAGSVLGGALVFLGAQYAHDTVYQLVHAVPFIPERLFATVYDGYEQRGLWSLFSGPISGIPYKVYALIAPAHAGLIPFLMVSIPVRLGRFLAVGGVGRAAGFLAEKSGRFPPEKLVAVHALLWALFYLFYWHAMSGG